MLTNLIQKETKITLGCQRCSEYFNTTFDWLLRQDECRCQKCRRFCEHNR